MTATSGIGSSEHEIQREIVRAIEAEGWAVFAIPNGGKRNAVTAMKLRAEGVRKGVPDLFIPALRLWLEVKKPKIGRLSKEQIAWRDYLIDCGYAWCQVRTVGDALEAVNDADKRGVPTRERIEGRLPS